MRLIVKLAASNWDSTANAGIECNPKALISDGLDVQEADFNHKVLQISFKDNCIGATLNYVKSGDGYIFFDEFDSIACIRETIFNGARNSVVNQLLAEMDGIDTMPGVYVIAATNRKDLIDPAILRPGRIDYIIEVPLPDHNGRKEIFAIHLTGKPMSMDIDLDSLARQTEGFSGAQIEEVCNRATWDCYVDAGFKYKNTLVTADHLQHCIDEIKKNVTDSLPSSHDVT